jgi:glycerophosphoryl diester phosphodiesterase
MPWEQPQENSIASHLHGMKHLDGVELDLRLSSDGELVLQHDAELGESRGELGGRSPWVELNSAAELAESGIELFADLVGRAGFRELWQAQAKVVCIELKAPHPSTGLAGGWREGRGRLEHLTRMVRQVNEMLAELELPHSNAVIYAFDPRILIAGKSVDSTLPLARLFPRIREWGSPRLKRIVAAPSFIANSLPRLMRWQRRLGAPMLPCALDYLVAPKNMLTLGRTVSLHGKGLQRLTDMRAGFPFYVWPSTPDCEPDLLNAGLTCLSDHTSPEFVTYPNGDARWPRPATQPLDADVTATLARDDADDHAGVLAELQQQVSPWHELSDGERRSLLDGWRSRWRWGRSIDELVADSDSDRMPWESVRIVGHRGAGRTDGGH